VRGTERLLEELEAFEVEQFVFSSTMLVHAPSEHHRKIDEKAPVKPKWAYPESKVRAERSIRTLHGKIPFVLLRIAGVYDDRCHSVPIAHQIERIHERHLTSHLYPGDLARGQAFVHLNDLVDAIALTVDKRATLPPDLTLLIGEPETLSYGSLQEALGCLIHGEEWKTTTIPKPAAKAGAWLQEKAAKLPGVSGMPGIEEPFIKPWMVNLADDHYELDIGRARSQLNWEPKHRLRDTLPRMIEVLKRDPESFYRENKLSEPIAPAVAARRALPRLAGLAAFGASVAGALWWYRRRQTPREQDRAWASR
jgi:nucleoside-diphosphate-sugar epimerase